MIDLVIQSYIQILIKEMYFSFHGLLKWINYDHKINTNTVLLVFNDWYLREDPGSIHSCGNDVILLHIPSQVTYYYLLWLYMPWLFRNKMILFCYLILFFLQYM